MGRLPFSATHWAHFSSLSRGNTQPALTTQSRFTSTSSHMSHRLVRRDVLGKEVNLSSFDFKEKFWRCQGKCRDRFGIIIVNVINDYS